MDAAKNTLNSATESASNAANQATNAVKGTTAEASKEGNKNIAEDSNASAGTRLNAAGDALGDKKDELKHKN